MKIYFKNLKLMQFLVHVIWISISIKKKFATVNLLKFICFIVK